MPSTTITEDKARLRAQVRRRMAAFSPDFLRESDHALFQHLLALPQLWEADTLFLFLGVGAEPDTLPLIRRLHSEGRRVALPRCLPGRRMECRLYDPDVPLLPSAFGIPEPSPLCPLVEREEIGFALVPALCCDRRGYRLGQGGGYYDRWLPGFSGFRAALCRRALLRDRVPAEDHDQPVQAVITEDGPLPSLQA